MGSRSYGAVFDGTTDRHVVGAPPCWFILRGCAAGQTVWR
jgi:hypothetical protein